MTAHLPQPQFVELPPPPDGLTAAVRRGRRIRRRRQALTAGGAATGMVAVLAVLALSGSTATGAQDELIPAGPRPALSAAASPAPTPSAQAGTTGGTVPRPAAAAARAGGTARAGGEERATAQPAARQSPPTSGVTRYRTPQLARSYRAAATSPGQGPNPTVCSGAVSGGGSGIDAASSWCFTARVKQTAAGHDLAVEVCRDSTGPGQLHYSRRLEVDLAVTRGTRTVWRWSTGHDDPPQPHVLDVAADACWTWTAPWTDVDADGDALAAGDYTLYVGSTASELRAFDDARAPFSID